MLNKYAEILSGLNNNESRMTPDSKILIIDGLNTFIRSFIANPTTNENGIHIGGIAGFLLSVGYAIKNIKPTRVIICFDGRGGSTKRRKLLPEYKQHRKVTQKTFRINSLSVEDEKVSMAQQMHRLIEYLENMPITILSVDNIEADDAIAYISQQVYNESNCYIMSTDKDFLQLVDDRVHVWSPTKKKYYYPDTIREEFGIGSQNFLTYRTITGDKSDNISGIRGAGVKTLKKMIPILFEDDLVGIDEIIHYIENSDKKSKLLKDILSNKDILERNYDLMQLKEVDISGFAKSSIMESVRNPIPRLNKLQISKMILEDMMNISIKNPDVWLREVFFTLDTMAIKTQ